MSLLPGTIPPAIAPIGTVGPDGKVVLDVNWWLFFYNVALNSIGINPGPGPQPVPDDTLEIVEDCNIDASTADQLQDAKRIINAMLLDDPLLQDPVSRETANALILATDQLLQTPTPAAQPAASVSPGGSPFTYTAPFDGTMVITGGNVSSVAIVRQGTSISTGVTVGLFPLRRSDQLTVTYSPGAPTMTFLT